MERGRHELYRQRDGVRNLVAKIRHLAGERGYTLSDEETRSGGPAALQGDPEFIALQSDVQRTMNELSSFEQRMSEVRFTANFGQGVMVVETVPDGEAIVSARARLTADPWAEQKIRAFRKVAADASIPLNAEGLLDVPKSGAALKDPVLKEAWEEAAAAWASRESAAALAAAVDFRNSVGPKSQPW